MYKDDKEFDDSWDAICTLNKNPWNQNFKGCSSKWHSQENYSTNPYWNKETKSYILPDKIENEACRQDARKPKICDNATK